jgi:peptidyl-dipeptidase A
MSNSWLAVILFCGAALAAIVPAACFAQGGSADERARRFIDRHDAEIRPLEIEVNRRGWDADVSGKAEDFLRKQQAEEKLALALADPKRFAELKAIRQAPPTDPILARTIEVLYRQYLERQIPVELLKQMLALDNDIQQEYNVFRPTIDGRAATLNDINNILTQSRDTAERKKTWEASKEIGRRVWPNLKKLVALRNESARRLGFADYHAMRLFIGEQDREQLVKLFDELDELTREPFRRAKREIDAALAAQCGIEPADLRPWHYHDQFFQEVPVAPRTVPEDVYKSLDSIEVCRKFYAGIGLPVDDVLERSSLYEQPGKNPQAFCTDIDRAGDVRILENVVPGREWLGTTLHELGHAVYSKGISRDLPYPLRNDAHPLTTEGVAMMFERLAQNVDWLRAVGANLPDAERYRAAADKSRRDRLLIFARWEQVMFRFEMAMYANPDQDLNRLWWDLVEKYQEVKRPEGRDAPDFAAKYHIVSTPAYYHNYMLGEMFASQLHHAIVKELSAQMGTVPFSAAIYVNQPAVGKFLTQRVFAPGMKYPWNEMIRRATGEELNPKAFAADLSEK